MHRKCGLFISICLSLFACVYVWIYACSWSCDNSTVHLSTNQSQNAMLPDVPHSMMTQNEEKAVRWHVEIRAEMRALTRDSRKEVSAQNGDFWCGNDCVKSEHVWRLWLDKRTTQEGGTEPLSGLISLTSTWFKTHTLYMSHQSNLMIKQ